MNTNAVQIELFQRIKPRLKKRKPVQELAGMLHLSDSAVYKRLNGTVPITMEEFVFLCQQFDISADELLGFSRSFLRFTQPLEEKPLNSYNDFLEIVLNDLVRLQKEDRPEIWYVTNEIPFFHQFLFPELSAFKYFYYARHVWELPAFQNHRFSLDNYWMQQPSRSGGRKLLNAYYQIPSVEVWTPHMWDNTLNQIRYFLETGAFKHGRDAVRILDAMRLMVSHLRKMCERNRKFVPHRKTGNVQAPFQVFCNEVHFSNNTFLVLSHREPRVYMTFDNPNFLKNSQASFAKYTHTWFKKLKKRSISLCQEHETYRQQFFNRLLRKLDEFEEHIKPLL